VSEFFTTKKFNLIFFPFLFTEISDSESDSSSQERKRMGDPYMKGRKPQTHKRRQKKQQRAAIPVSTPKIPMGFEASGGGMNAAALMYQKLKNEINSNLEKGKTNPQFYQLIH
jgi:hypothetical protein